MGKNGSPVLSFGQKFSNWNTGQQLEYLKKLAASQNEALDLMQKERNKLAVEVAKLKRQVKSAEDALYIQKNINRAAITKQNADVQEAGQCIQELKEKLREVCG